MRDDLWGRLAGLEASAERYRLERHELPTPGFTRRSTTVVVEGGGAAGQGEDVSYNPEDQDSHGRVPALPLHGRRTLAEWSAFLDEQVLFPEPTRQAAARHYRRWAYESALLELALRQAGVTLGHVLGGTYAPVRFVVSSNLSPERWISFYPHVELKVDARADWTRADLVELAWSGSVRVVDLKAHYGADYPQEARDEAGLAALVAELFPDAVIEDPPVDAAAMRALRGAGDRIAFDAPVHSVDDLARLPPVRHLNIKPSRFGTTERLCACLDHCRKNGIAMYAGGQFELGVGRAQIQALASLFYPDGPNDCAPGVYNAPEPALGLAESPLPESAWRSLTPL